MFSVFFSADYSADIVICALTVFCTIGLGLAIGKLFCRITRSPRLLAFMMTGCEVGMLGYPFYILLFGSENLQNMAMLDLGHVTFIFTIYVTLLRNGGGGVKASLKNMAKTPILWAIAAGAVFGATGLSKLLEPSGAAAVIKASADFIAAPLSCTILFVIGYGVELNRRTIGPALRSVAARYVCCALLCLFALTVIGLFMPVTDMLRWAVIMIFILPAPYIIPLFVTDDAEKSYASVCLSVQTLFSVAFFAVIAAIAVH